MKIRNICCPYDSNRMKYIGTERLQKGRYGFFTGHLDNYLSGALTVSIYECPECGRLEFFRYKKEKKNADGNIRKL